MKEKIRYDCKDNDNNLTLFFEDGLLDEVHVGDPLEKGWTVISADDLEAAIKQAEDFILARRSNEGD